MYGGILLPTDGSEGTEQATKHALDHAQTYGATLHVLHVVNEELMPLDEHSKKALTVIENEGRESVDEVVDEAEAMDVEVVGAIVHGTPDVAIVEYARENDVDLVVMGTHGRSGLDRFLIGSTTDKVIRTAHVPVLAVPVD